MTKLGKTPFDGITILLAFNGIKHLNMRIVTEPLVQYLSYMKLYLRILNFHIVRVKVFYEGCSLSFHIFIHLKHPEAHQKTLYTQA